MWCARCPSPTPRCSTARPARPGANRWLTALDDASAPGDEHTLSFGHPLFGGEFCHLRLGPVVAHTPHGRPLFDLDDAEADLRNGTWATLREVRAAKDVAWTSYPCRIDLKGHTFERQGFGGFRQVDAQNEAAA